MHPYSQPNTTPALSNNQGPCLTPQPFQAQNSHDMLMVAIMPYHWICPSSLPNMPRVTVTPIPVPSSSWGASASSGGCQTGDREGGKRGLDAAPPILPGHAFLCPAPLMVPGNKWLVNHSIGPGGVLGLGYQSVMLQNTRQRSEEGQVCGQGESQAARLSRRKAPGDHDWVYVNRKW